MNAEEIKRVRLYDGCYGVTRHGKVDGPLTKSYDECFRLPNNKYFDFKPDGSHSCDYSDCDLGIMAVFPTREEAEAFMRVTGG